LRYTDFRRTKLEKISVYNILWLDIFRWRTWAQADARSPFIFIFPSDIPLALIVDNVTIAYWTNDITMNDYYACRYRLSFERRKSRVYRVSEGA